MPALPIVPARAVLRELHDLYLGEAGDALKNYTIQLQLTDPRELHFLETGLRNILARASSDLRDRNPSVGFIFGAYNTISFLERTSRRESVEELYHQLVPMAQKAGNQLDLAYVLMAAAATSERCDEPERTIELYDQAIAAARAGGARYHPWMIRAHEFKITAAMEALKEIEYYEPPHQRLLESVSGILAIADHPMNKHPAYQASLEFLSALSNAASACEILEKIGHLEKGSGERIASRVAVNAAVSEDPERFPHSLIELSKHRETHGDWGEAIALKIIAAELLCRLPDHGAQKAAQSTIRGVMASIAARPPPDDPDGTAEHSEI